MSLFMRRMNTPLSMLRPYGARQLGTITEAGKRERLATIRIYRLLQRAARSFAGEKPSDQILLQPAIEPTHWGRHVMFFLPESSQATDVEELFRLFHTWNDDTDDWYLSVVGKSGGKLPPMVTETCWTTPENLQQAIRVAFKSEYGSDATTLTKWAIRAAQVLQEQKAMWTLSSCETTEHIRVTATSRCIGTSDPTSHFPPAASPSGLQSKHRFAYRMRIENLSENYVQLLGRYWHISEEAGNDDPVVVDAPGTGAVGQLPVLRPNQVFEYTSGADLGNSIGEMKGHFYMARVTEDAISLKSGDAVGISQDGKILRARVSPFPLIAA